MLMLFILSLNIEQARAYCDKLTDAITKSETPNRAIKIFPGLVTYVAETHEQAMLKSRIRSLPTY